MKFTEIKFIGTEFEYEGKEQSVRVGKVVKGELIEAACSEMECIPLEYIYGIESI